MLGLGSVGRGDEGRMIVPCVTILTELSADCRLGADLSLTPDRTGLEGRSRGARIVKQSFRSSGSESKSKLS